MERIPDVKRDYHKGKSPKTAFISDMGLLSLILLSFFLSQELLSIILL